MSHGSWPQFVVLCTLTLSGSVCSGAAPTSAPANERAPGSEPPHYAPACTPGGGTVETAVTFDGPPGVTLAGLGIVVEYPARKLTTPTFSAAAGVGNVTNDQGDRFVAEPIRVTGLPKPFMRAKYKRCDGAEAAAANDFKCTVTDAADDQGNVVEARRVTCAVTIP